MSSLYHHPGLSRQIIRIRFPTARAANLEKWLPLPHNPLVIELFKDIHYIPGKNRSRYPYCACLYIKGSRLRVLIDAGMGREHLAPVLEQGLDVLIMSHSHVDHRLTRRHIQNAPVWCHNLETPYLSNAEAYYQGLGLPDGDASKLPEAFLVDVSRELSHGETIDLGGLTLEVIHTPGHTPGHLSFFIPEHRFLFTADVDLTAFGPYYGHEFADINDFIRSVHTLKTYPAKTAATGHAGPFSDDLNSRFDRYESIFYERERAVLDRLEKPRILEALTGINLIYPKYHNRSGTTLRFEGIHIRKHLERLARQGLVRRDNGLWFRE